MPIPTRSKHEPQAGTEVKSRIPSARLHQRTTSTVVPDAVKENPRTHQRTTSLIPQQANVESSSSSLLRKPSIRSNAAPGLQPSTITARQASKPIALLPESAKCASSNTERGLRQSVLKPHFSIYQQQFSPMKPPRPAFIASDTPSTNERAITQDSPEIVRLRDELLQLRLMHAGSTKTLQQFESDAKTKLESRFDALTKQYQSIVAVEQHKNQSISYVALQNWLHEGDVFSNKLHRLASCLRDLDSLTAKDGKYSNLMKRFQTWFEQMILARGSRKQSTETMSPTLLFVEPIDPVWLQEAVIIQGKLQSTRQVLHSLGNADAGGLQFVLSIYQRLTENLSQELDTCLLIHSVALEQGDAWLEQSLQGLLEGDVPASCETFPIRRKGIWEDSAVGMS